MIVLDDHVSIEVSLDDLARTANEEYHAAGNSLVSSIHHAILCGEALLDAKTRIKFGDWTSWAAENLDFSKQRAERLMRLAFYKDHLPKEATRPWSDRAGKIQTPSFERALSYVKGLPHLSNGQEMGDYVPASSGPKAPINADTRREIIRLNTETDLTQHDIAAMLGISQATVWRYLNPGKHAERRSRLNAKRRAERADRRKHKEKQERTKNDALARKLGGPLGESWSLVHRLAQRLDQAYAQESDSHTKIELGVALARLYDVEDALRICLGRSEPRT